MLTVDAHCDLLSHLLEFGTDVFYKNTDAQITKNSWLSGGPDLLVMAIYISQRYLPHQKEAQALKMAGIFWKLVSAADFIPVLQKDDLVNPSPKALLAIEGGEPLTTEEDLYAFYRLGVRMISLAWNYQNHLATGCLETYPGGLTLRGKQIVKAAEALGTIVDVSHLSEGSFWDVVRISRMPIIASHSNAYRLKNHPRNLKDAALIEIARSGGVVGVNFYPDFLENDTLQAVILQIQYLVDLIGIDHIGIGSDFLGIDSAPKGLETIAKWRNLDAALDVAGFNAPEREAILGGNFCRIFNNIL